MPQDPAAALGALLRQSSIADHDEVLKAANSALKADKNDTVSQHTRIVALLKLDRFDDALRAIAEGSTILHSRCVLEHAYALYKTGKLDEATSVLQSAGIENKRSFRHVAAQVAYRAERFDEARSIYSRLLDTDAADEENDLSINLRAAFAQSNWLGYSSANSIAVQDSDGFELCYNAACAHIARGSLETAADLLQRAIRLCDASDDLTEEDKQAEMRPILSQQAYVHAKLAQNNLVALEPKAENPYLLQRRFASMTDKEKEAKLFKHQSNILRRNNLVVDLQVFKAPGVQRRTNALLADVEHPTTSADAGILSVLNAAASTQGTNGKQLLRSLQNLSQKRPRDVGLVLTIVQIQLNEGHTGSALSILESFLQRLDKAEAPDAQDVRFSPSLVALVVTLLRVQGRESSAKAELVKAATHWQSRHASSATSLLEEAGVELMKSSNAQDLQLAGASFQRLFDEQKGSDIAAAGLVASLAPSNPSRVEQHLQTLPSVDSLIEGIDVQALLSAGVATTSTKTSQGVKRAAPQESAERTRKRRRKIRLPKNYAEGTKPDPERWLPLRDRSSYRPKGKKGKKKAGEATQGGIVKEEETLELVGGGGVKVEKAPPTSSKKKKKGKK
ncbi:signal recognition particle subunit SRP72 [Fusarium albosuccineum]|uniref:Signal recognition particle subunit SRP72 n=1 Tax=Fusarium albosuccineum TaxID=1237068 RepID=A0A8H4L242_9HYPO|nr:signal recognition particle subunit SRP72 [Fusarium albosuccineum]